MIEIKFQQVSLNILFFYLFFKNIFIGYWGCGAFGGDKVHKFLQQVCAATLTNTPLYFSCYNDLAMCNQLKSILQAIYEASMLF